MPWLFKKRRGSPSLTDQQRHQIAVATAEYRIAVLKAKREAIEERGYEALMDLQESGHRGNQRRRRVSLYGQSSLSGTVAEAVEVFSALKELNGDPLEQIERLVAMQRRAGELGLGGERPWWRDLVEAAGPLLAAVIQQATARQMPQTVPMPAPAYQQPAMPAAPVPAALPQGEPVDLSQICAMLAQEPPPDVVARMLTEQLPETDPRAPLIDAFIDACLTTTAEDDLRLVLQAQSRHPQLGPVAAVLLEHLPYACRLRDSLKWLDIQQRANAAQGPIGEL